MDSSSALGVSSEVWQFATGDRVHAAGMGIGKVLVVIGDGKEQEFMIGSKLLDLGLVIGLVTSKDYLECVEEVLSCGL